MGEGEVERRGERVKARHGSKVVGKVSWLGREKVGR